MNSLNYGVNYYDFIGGRQDGELYILSVHGCCLHECAHIYIYHSTDYGKTFEVFHPFAKGEDPLVANFSTAEISSIVPLTVQFSNYSIGDIQSYEWDFDNDGTIDSYEEEPEYTYLDTGYYSVSLTINYMQSITATRYNYIHVTVNADVDNNFSNLTMLHLENSPNPFRESTTITYTLPHNIHKSEIQIYNMKVQLVRKLKNSKSKIKN